MKSAFAEYLITTGRVSRHRLEAIIRTEWLEHEPIGRLALLHGLLNSSDIDEVLRQQDNDDHLFGEIAVRLGVLTPQQVDILFRGQAIRACVELVEDLALAQVVDFQTGVDAIKEFISGPDFVTAMTRHTHAAV